MKEVILTMMAPVSIRCTGMILAGKLYIYSYIFFENNVLICGGCCYCVKSSGVMWNREVEIQNSKTSLSVNDNNK
jgi:hypothetical protein